MKRKATEHCRAPWNELAAFGRHHAHRKIDRVRARKLAFECLEDRRVLASFQPLFEIEGIGGRVAYEMATSSNGDYIAGHFGSNGGVVDGTEFSGNELFLWDAGTGVRSLGGFINDSHPSGGVYYHAPRPFSVSDDGSVVVASANGNTFRWLEQGGLQLLEPPQIPPRPGEVTRRGIITSVYGSSNDGSKISGAHEFQSVDQDSGWIHVAAQVLWEDSVPHVYSENPYYGTRFGAVSGDGSTLTWKDEDGWAVGELDNWTYLTDFYPSWISRDGSLLIGIGSDSGIHGSRYRWTAADGLVELNFGVPFWFTDASDDGFTVVGFQIANGSYSNAAIWDPIRGMQSLTKRLANQGISSELSSWSNLRIEAISDDGTTISGYGNYHARITPWIAHLDPEPLLNFTHQQADTSGLEISFDRDFQEDPFLIRFYRSDDSTYDPSDTRVGTSISPFYEIEVSAQGIDGAPNVTLAGGVNGTFTLKIDPSDSLLESALEDPNANFVLAAAFEMEGDTASFADVPFEGVYHGAAGRTAVVRSGLGTSDTVTINAGLNISLSEDGVESHLTNIDAPNVLVMTHDLNDIIDVGPNVMSDLNVKTGAGDDELEGGLGSDILDGGLGSDSYLFGASAGGSDNLIESSVEEIDRLDFSFFPSPVAIDLEYPELQSVAPELGLTLSASDAFENVTGTEFSDRIKGNGWDNRIIGRGGDDFLVGDGGTDTLLGDDGIDVLLGDGFLWNHAQWFGAAGGFEGLLSSNSHSFGIGLIPSEGTNDILMGGNDDDVIIGGDGDDTIEAGPGRALIFGDSFQAGAELTFSFADAITNLSLAYGLLNVSAGLALSGNGGDTITAGDQSSLVIGGAGNDTIMGGDSSSGLDLLFGNDGQDTIDGRAGTNLIVGGDQDDPMLTGGNGFNFVIGDSLAFDADIDLSQDVPSSFQDTLALLETVLAGVTFEGHGADTIKGGAGTNLVLGGPGLDTIEGGDGSVDVLFGNANYDFIDGKGGYNLIVGGGDAGDELIGGDDGNVIIGGDLEVEGFSIDIKKLLELKILEAIALPSFTVSGTALDVDYIRGGSGFDFIVGAAGSDEIYGGDGINMVFGDDINFQVGGVAGVVQNVASIAADIGQISLGNPLAAKDAVEGLIDGFHAIWNLVFGNSEDNADEYYGGADTDIVFGGPGDDILRGGLGKDLIVGGYGNDRIEKEPGEVVDDGFFNTISYGGEGDDTFVGGDGHDFLASTNGRDTFRGLRGNDVIFGGDGQDVISGGEGVDSLFGEGGDDVIYGVPGVDEIDGGDGVNQVFTIQGMVLGDYNADLVVDAADYTVWRDNLNSTAILPGDITPGSITIDDYSAWRDNFGNKHSTNTLPTISQIDDLTVLQGEPVRDVIFTADDLETQLSALSFEVTSSNEALVPASGIEVVQYESTHLLWITTNPAESGSSVIRVRVIDESGDFVTESFVIEVLPREIPAATLTHWYTFSDGSGTDRVGDADLVLHNEVLVADGQAILSNQNLLSGDADNLSYLELPVEALPQGDSVTIEVWFTSDAAPDWTQLFNFGTQFDGAGDLFLAYSPKTGAGESEASFQTDNLFRYVAAATTDDGLPHVVAVVIDSDADTLILYVDGIKKGSDSLNGEYFAALPKTFAYFGRSLFDEDPGFTGSIDEIRIYDGAIDADAVSGMASLATVSSLNSGESDDLPHAGIGSLTHDALKEASLLETKSTVRGSVSTLYQANFVTWWRSHRSVESIMNAPSNGFDSNLVPDAIDDSLLAVLSQSFRNDGASAWPRELNAIDEALASDDEELFEDSKAEETFVGALARVI